jgi:spore coat polysaccharide biosynthesis protein SpsF
MSSTRLPGKVLMPIVDRTLLGMLMDRLARCRAIDTIIVATSDQPDDDAIAQFCADESIDVFRGPLEDVAARFAGAARSNGLDAFVRVCADSPLLDPLLVDAAAARIKKGDCDVVTNVMPRTYPPGQSVEAVTTTAFARSRAFMTAPADREHVTRALYANAENFRIERILRVEPCTEPHLVVDTADDLTRIAAVVKRMDRPHWQYSLNEILELARTVP